MKYWQLEPYAGFGADAHCFDGTIRGQNIESPSEYVERIQSGQSARIDASPANTAEERFFVGLRLTHGIQPRAEEWLKFEQLHRALHRRRAVGAGWRTAAPD